jgi:AcrR family transcriptional regulator
MTAPETSNRRLTADDWIQAGFELLADGGPNALRIGSLCDRLAVTKGSFYWHFTDMAAYRAALTIAWGGLHDERRRRFDRMYGVAPRHRLAEMMATLVRPDHWALERAMRVWALTDEAVHASVQRSDARVMRAVRQAFLDHGFTQDEASLRAGVLLAAGVGFLHSVNAGKDVPAEVRDRVLDFMLRR